MPNLIDELIGNEEIHKVNIDIDVIDEKMAQANIPGMIVEFSPEEAEFLGAFRDDSMELKDIIDGSLDLVDAK
ncbi:hypothetical protein ACFGZK_10980 [Pasteurella multocida]